MWHRGAGIFERLAGARIDMTLVNPQPLHVRLGISPFPGLSVLVRLAERLKSASIGQVSNISSRLVADGPGSEWLISLLGHLVLIDLPGAPPGVDLLMVGSCGQVRGIRLRNPKRLAARVPLFGRFETSGRPLSLTTWCVSAQRARRVVGGRGLGPASTRQALRVRLVDPLHLCSL
ncbi:MAG: hypothetical protein M3072_13815 [Candidatus Dormibacteraeota bacterium]|nr:hypothetical protein [Candidatus Dormibacteraeota bacterium]